MRGQTEHVVSPQVAVPCTSRRVVQCPTHVSWKDRLCRYLHLKDSDCLFPHFCPLATRHLRSNAVFTFRILNLFVLLSSLDSRLCGLDFLWNLSSNSNKSLMRSLSTFKTIVHVGFGAAYSTVSDNLECRIFEVTLTSLSTRDLVNCDFEICDFLVS